jgi:hypothetical protein
MLTDHRTKAFVCVLFALAAIDQRTFVLSRSITQLTPAFYCSAASLHRRTSLSASSSSDRKQCSQHVLSTNRTISASGKSDTEYVTRRKQIYPSGNVVSRLKQAAMQAAAALAMDQLQESIEMKNTFFSNRSALSSKVETMKNQGKMGTLLELTSEIDLQLHRARALPWEQYQTHMLYHNQQPRFQKQPHHVSVLPRDSMTAIITHNNQNQVTSRGLQFFTSTIMHQPNINMTTTTSQPTSSAILTTTLRHVAIVLTKRSILRDGKRCLTVESAGRIQRLLHAMNYENYKPSVIVIVGEQHTSIQDSVSRVMYQSPSTTRAIVDEKTTSDADLGYAYFIHLLNNDQSPKVDLSNVTFHLERSTLSTQALENISSLIQQEFIPQWLEEAIEEAESQQVSFESAPPHPRLKDQQQQFHRRWKLHVQCAIISSDYHLCILNDIHVRSPGQSFLRALDRWSFSSVMKNLSSAYRNADDFQPSSYYSGIQLESSWIYMYATIANIRLLKSSLSCVGIEPFTEKGKESDSDFELSFFMASCYHRAQELIPVLHNLRGVVANTEFFQRDNYRVLVQARRCLVAGMERLYQQQPSLSAVHKVLSSHNVSKQMRDCDLMNNRRGTPLDVVLEGALLSLGRCLDLVRPAGLLTGSVPSHDFKLALMILDQAVSLISIACDPDQPLFLHPISDVVVYSQSEINRAKLKRGKSVQTSIGL